MQDPSFMKGYVIHDCFSFLGPTLQQLGGMSFGPTKGMPFLPYNQPMNPKNVINLKMLI
jgi:hypothetical protein